jgi:hypothetical protein
LRSGCAYLNDFLIPHLFDVAHRGLTEEATVFTIELTDAFVSNLKGNRRRVDPIDEHSASRRMQP